MPKFILYSYWRSSCSWRVRTALLLKGFEYEYRSINLLGSPQPETSSPEFKKLNPCGQVPALTIHDSGKQITLIQSVAILQYLDEAYPQTQPLLPVDPLSRAHVRIITDCIAAGIQPLQNITLLNKLKSAGLSSLEYAKEMISSRFAELELILKETSGKYCVGDEVTMADVCLVPQVYNAVRYGVDVAQFPLIHRINADLLKLPAFADGHPDRQPDAPK